MLPMMISAFIFSFGGAFSASRVPKALMEYLVLVVLIVMAVYTFAKKDLGKTHHSTEDRKEDAALSVGFGAVIGFYDGVFGPGSGSILLFVFVKYFGFDFLNASASAKIINLGTFTAALIFFIPSGNVLWAVGGLVAVCNMAGSLSGAFLALRYGSNLVRVLFLVLLVFLIGRMAITLLSRLWGQGI